MFRVTTLCVMTCLLFTFGLDLRSEDWPQFRGPNCSGISRSTRSLPTEFANSIRWRKELGDGIGSPIVAAGRVFISSMEGDERVRLSCFDAASGERQWAKDLDTGELDPIHKKSSYAATTAAADAQRVYFYHSALGLMAFDSQAGNQVWHVDLPVPYFVFNWGPGMSPVIYENKVFFCQDDDLNPAVYAFDARTGDELWKTDRTEMAVNYSHPIICETDQGPELVVGGTGKLIGYDLKSGQPLWYARTLLRNIKTTPVSRDGVIYVSLQSHGIAHQWRAIADRDHGNSDGKVTKAEMQASVGDRKIPDAFMKRFDRGDRNGDGFLEGEEIDLAFLDPDNHGGARWDAEEVSEQFILCVRGGGRGDVTETHVVWKHSSRAPDHIVSPLVVDGRMWLVKGGGIASCFNTNDGEPVWYQKRIRNSGEYFASPVYGDGKVYVIGENGVVVVLENGPTLKVLATNDLGGSCLATPAIADGRIYFRLRKELVCVGG